LHACRTFAISGWEVIAILSPRSLISENLTAVHAEGCDLTDGTAVNKLLGNIRPDAVLHLAGRNAVDASWREPAATLAANLMSTANLLEGVRAIDSCRMLVVGSMLRSDPSRLAEALHPYGFSKTLQAAAAQAWHHWYSLPVMIAEPSNLVGPGNSGGLCGKIVRWVAASEELGEKQTPFRLSSLDESRDFLDVRDAAAAYEAILNKGLPGVSYAIESGIRRTLGEVKAAFDEAAAVRLRWIVGDDQPSPSPLSRDASRIRELGWRPSTTFSESIRRALADERRRRKMEGGEPSFRIP
jgi:GDP-4-dehydro-6-deoxy-D-mannose reductase